MALFTFDPTTDRGKVRLLISDDVESYGGSDIYFFTDAKIDAFLEMAADLDGSLVRFAAAEALESWASNQLMVLKVVQRLDVKTDGAAVAREMRMRAEVLRKAAKDSSSDDAGFEIAEMLLGPASYDEQVLNRAIRSSY